MPFSSIATGGVSMPWIFCMHIYCNIYVYVCEWVRWMGKHSPNFMNNELNHFDEGHRILFHVGCTLVSFWMENATLRKCSYNTKLPFTFLRFKYFFSFFISFLQLSPSILFIIWTHVRNIRQYATWTINGNLSRWYNMVCNFFFLLHSFWNSACLEYINEKDIYYSKLTQTTATKSFTHLKRCRRTHRYRMKNICNFHRIYIYIFYHIAVWKMGKVCLILCTC